MCYSITIIVLRLYLSEHTLDISFLSTLWIIIKHGCKKWECVNEWGGEK